eukprot:TRINITY_DN6535_c0_g1_i1.p1 TRINITY_DN6535_c0_g1~~TRINITY_DN6535_c0_g1_i1.p1  ORF type:complete len:404 (-),score=6.74 TRINITY_DN6535_c0_g1_i1:7-1185(-)
MRRNLLYLVLLIVCAFHSTLGDKYQMIYTEDILDANWFEATQLIDHGRFILSYANFKTAKQDYDQIQVTDLQNTLSKSVLTLTYPFRGIVKGSRSLPYFAVLIQPPVPYGYTTLEVYHARTAFNAPPLWSRNFTGNTPSFMDMSDNGIIALINCSSSVSNINWLNVTNGEQVSHSFTFPGFWDVGSFLEMSKTGNITVISQANETYFIDISSGSPKVITNLHLQVMAGCISPAGDHVIFILNPPRLYSLSSGQYTFKWNLTRPQNLLSFSCAASDSHAVIPLGTIIRSNIAAWQVFNFDSPKPVWEYSYNISTRTMGFPLSAVFSDDQKMFASSLLTDMDGPALHVFNVETGLVFNNTNLKDIERTDIGNDLSGGYLVVISQLTGFLTLYQS